MEFIFYIMFWLILSFIIGYVGSKKRIGFTAALVLSLLFTPLIGLWICLHSKNLEDIERETKMLMAIEDLRDCVDNLPKKNIRN